MNKIVRMDRRSFLKGAGMLVVSVGAPLPFNLVEEALAAEKWPLTMNMNMVDSFLAIAADGKVTGFCGHIDMGQGIHTSLAQMVAEELDVAFEKVTMVLGDTDKTPDQGRTTASETLAFAAVPLRRAAAEARLWLVARAEVILGADYQTLVVEDGVVFVRNQPSRRIAYEKIIGGQKFNLEVLRNAPLKDPTTYRVIGKSVRRVDIPSKIAGTFEYIQNVRVPGMLHGRVVRPPTAGFGNAKDVGATLVSVDEASVAGVPGLVKVVVNGNFIGVVCEREENAIRAARTLKVTWKTSADLPAMNALPAALHAAKATPNVLGQRGDAEAAMNAAARKFTAEYFWPYNMHASIGPSCAVADVKPDQVEIWSGTQNPHQLRADLSLLLDRPQDQIRVMKREAAGCYGRNCADDASADAALLSAAVGKPVRVQLMRNEENGWDPKGVATTIALKGGLDATGNVVAWDFETVYLSGSADTLPLVLTGKRGVIGVSRGWQGAVQPYNFPNARTVVQEGEPILLRVAWLRGVAAVPNMFGTESFVDELAAAAKKDPVEFRLQYMSDPRAIDVLQAAVKKAKWDPRPSPKPAAGGDVMTGRGVAYARYAHTRAGTLVPGAYVALVTEVEVKRSTGQVRVTKMTIAHDCGLIINPEGVKHQVHGNAVQMVSRTLKEEVKFDKNGVTSLDWEAYPLLTFPEVPDIDVVLINRPNEVVDGAGEATSVPIGAAIGNAIFDATGVRFRTVPFTPDRILAGLRANT